MKKTKIIDKLKQRRKKKGFTLVELVVVILIIAVLASATFLGGATVIKQARTTKATNDLRNYSSYLEDMFYNHPGYASKGIASGKVAESLNEYLTADLAVKAGANESKGTSESLKDAWDNAYNYAYYKNPTATEAAVLVWSNGPDQVKESDLTSIEPTIVGDDIAVLVKMVNGEVSTLTSDSLAESAGGAGGGETPTTVKAVVEGGIITSDWGTLKTVSQEIENDNSVTSATTDLTEKYGLKVGDKLTQDGNTYYVAGFNHDTTNEEKGITFICKHTSDYAMNGSDGGKGNAGGYVESEMYGYVNGLILPVETKTVTKAVDDGNSNYNVTGVHMNRWLLSYHEIGFTGTSNVKVEGTAYPIFTSNAKRAEVGSSSTWWLRSSYTGNIYGFQCVASHGNSSYNHASYAMGVIFGFCI